MGLSSPFVYFLFPSLSLVMAMQCRYETYIVWVLKDNNIMISRMSMTFYRNVNLNHLPRSPSRALCILKIASCEVCVTQADLLTL